MTAKQALFPRFGLMVGRCGRVAIPFSGHTETTRVFVENGGRRRHAKPRLLSYWEVQLRQSVKRSGVLARTGRVSPDGEYLTGTDLVC
jgi:hypothetical protein